MTTKIPDTEPRHPPNCLCPQCWHPGWVQDVPDRQDPRCSRHRGTCPECVKEQAQWLTQEVARLKQRVHILEHERKTAREMVAHLTCSESAKVHWNDPEENVLWKIARDTVERWRREEEQELEEPRLRRGQP